jgi:hypothetical protein
LFLTFTDFGSKDLFVTFDAINDVFCFNIDSGFLFLLLYIAAQDLEQNFLLSVALLHSGHITGVMVCLIICLSKFCTVVDNLQTTHEQYNKNLVILVFIQLTSLGANMRPAMFNIADIHTIGQSHKLGPGVSSTPSATNMPL